MARHDVYREQGTETMLLDCQADVLSHLHTRLVVPLLPVNVADETGRLTPIFDLNGRRVIMATQLAASVDARLLRNPVASLEHEHDRIMAAFDMLLTGV